MTLAKTLLVSCDTFWGEEVPPGFDEVYFGDPIDLTDAQAANLSHWIVDPAPNYKINDELIKRFNCLRAIGSPSTGTTHINISDRSDLQVRSLRDVDLKSLHRITASSEFTFLLFLNLVKNFKIIHEGNIDLWRSDLNNIRGRQVSEMSIGIFGTGRIGGNLSAYLNAMGASVHAYEPNNNNFVPNVQYHDFNGFLDFLNKADAVFVCFHYTPENEEFIDRQVLNSINDDAFFINTSRGENVDEKELTASVNRGKFSGIAIDVVSQESLGKFSDRPLIEAIMRHKNGLVTPHVAGVSHESEKMAFNFIFDEIVKL